MIIFNTDPQEIQKTILPGTQMETFLGTPRSTTPGTPRATTLGTPKTPRTPRYSTHRDIILFSQGIYSCYFLSNSYLLRSLKGVTYESLTPKTKVVSKIRKILKEDK